VYDDVRFHLLKETDDRIATAQVILFGTRDSDMLTPPLSQLLHDE
jgi:hypothetical protein